MQQIGHVLDIIAAWYLKLGHPRCESHTNENLTNENKVSNLDLGLNAKGI